MSVQQSNISYCSFHNSVNANGYEHNGGAFHIQNSYAILTVNEFQHNTAKVGAALSVEFSTLNLTRNTFHSNSAQYGGAIYITISNSIITGNTFTYNSGGDGGVFHMLYSTLTLTGNTFQNNSADSDGGAVCVLYSTLNLTGNTFQSNSADSDGGAICVLYSTLNLTGNTFQSNSAYFNGGAICVLYSTLNLTRNTFQSNSAQYGGAVYVQYGTLNLTKNTLPNNSAENDGGALYVQYSTLSLTGNTFQNNSAIYSGGAQYVFGSTLHFLGNTFQKSYSVFGGTVYMSTSNVTFTDDCFTDSYAELGGAVLANSNSIVKMYNITFGNNRAEYGGGMAAVDSQLEVLDSTLFENNRANYGGGLYVHNTEFVGNAMFTKNSVTEGGGGIFASVSSLFLTDNTTLKNNSALHGGGLLLSGDAKLLLQPGIAVHFISNSARSTGGAIKVEESNTLTYCIPANDAFDLIHSDCFFQIKGLTPMSGVDILDICIIDFPYVDHTVCFDNNSAVEAGNDLYGGSVDKCTFNRLPCKRSGYLFDAITSCENKPTISSDPLHICTCRDDLTYCTGSYHPEPVYPGGTLEVPVIALGQRNGATIAVIEVTDASNTTVGSLEYSQKIDNSCNTLKYTIYSRAIGTTQEMTLYAQGPCSPSQTNTLTVTVNIKHCPPGFQLSMDQPICICAERLQQFTNTCLVDSTTVLREHNAQFWVGYDSDSESRGLILHPNCPFDYCTSEETYLAVDDSDKQCN